MSDPSQVIQFVEWNVVAEEPQRVRELLAAAIEFPETMTCPNEWDRAVWTRLATEHGVRALTRCIEQDCKNELWKRGEKV